MYNGGFAMVSRLTEEEIEAIRRNLKETRERVRRDPKEAIRVLHAAGITDMNGKVVYPYRQPGDK